MTAKEYLSQARRLDDRITSKIQRLDALNALAVKCTGTLGAMPGGRVSGSRLEDTITKIADMQDEISADIAALVDLKAEIAGAIRAVEDPICQMILEKRYLCFLPWEQIAVELGYNMRQTFWHHDRALRCISVPQRGKETCL